MANEFNSLWSNPQQAATVLEDASPSECKTLHTVAANGKLAASFPSAADEVAGQPFTPSKDSRIHILFIIDELCEIGGAERVLFKMIRSLPSEQFRCSLLTFRINGEADLSKIACPVQVLPLRKTYNWNAVKVAQKIRSFVRQEKVAIVHTFFETSDLWAGPIAKLSGAPILISNRRDLGILRSWKHRIGYRVLRSMYDSVLTVSPQVREFCIQQDGLDPNKVQTLFSGLDMDCVSQTTSRALMREELGIPETAPVIITVGNIRRVKGIDILVKAAASVCHNHPDAVFLVVGRKSEMDHCRELENRISALGLAKNFRMIGGREDVFAILRMSDIFCLPSRSEGFSNALIEAMACSLPCVATDVGGNMEVVSQGQTGFLVPNEDSQEIALALDRLLSDPQKAKEMGLHGETIVRSRFTTEAMRNNLIHVYQRLVAAKERH